MRKKIILNIAIVVAVVFIFDFVIGKTLRYYYFKQTSGFNFRTTHSLEKTNAEILIFGSSRASHHYVPEVFEDSLKMSYFNAGRDGMGIFYQLAVLKSALKRYKPKVIILDFAGGFEKEQRDYDRLSVLLPYYKTHQELRDIIELKSPFERIKLLSEIYPFNSEILRIASGNFDSNRKGETDKGYLPIYGIWQAKIDSVKSFEVYPDDSIKLKAFRDFVITAKESGSFFAVLYSPIFLKFPSYKGIETCRDICLKENVPFWNFSKDTLFLNNQGFFSDKLHLNHNGAKLYSNIVVEKIKQYINFDKCK